MPPQYQSDAKPWYDPTDTFSIPLSFPTAGYGKVDIEHQVQRIERAANRIENAVAAGENQKNKKSIPDRWKDRW